MWQEKISFKDVSIASHQNIKERNYWLDQLAGELTKSNFPYDYHHTGAGDKVNKRIEFNLDDLLFSQLMKISKGIDYTLHMILTAAAAALLSRYSGHNDIIVGMPIYRQDSNESFVNKVVALRIYLDDAMTFKDLLLQVRQTVIDADQHQNYAIEALIYQLSIPDPGTDFPLFDCAILLENIHDKTYLKDISLNTVFSFSRGNGNLTGVFEYNSLRYREETAQQVTGHFKNLLASFLHDMNARIGSVEFLTPTEKQQLLCEFNDTDIIFPVEKTIVDLFEEQVERTPDHIALVGAADAETAADHFLSYREFNRRANNLAHLLRQKGARPNTLVGLMADRTINTMTGIAGILKAGSAYLPIDPESPISRIVPILEEAGPKILLTKNALLKNFTFTSLQGLRHSPDLPSYTAARPPIADLDNHPFPDR
ncbi:MAG TPA: condensation domain-containing protein, partial [Candidatus Deferrimicrobium sp.]|nr:condensation domain-containing protein [Candidatus Deferrimicrobium sp.]